MNQKSSPYKKTYQSPQTMTLESSKIGLGWCQTPGSADSGNCETLGNSATTLCMNGNGDATYCMDGSGY